MNETTQLLMVIGRHKEALSYCIAMIDGAMADNGNSDADLELAPDGSYMLSDARAVLAQGIVTEGGDAPAAPGASGGERVEPDPEGDAPPSSSSSPVVRGAVTR